MNPTKGEDFLFEIDAHNEKVKKKRRDAARNKKVFKTAAEKKEFKDSLERKRLDHVTTEITTPDGYKVIEQAIVGTAKDEKEALRLIRETFKERAELEAKLKELEKAQGKRKEEISAELLALAEKLGLSPKQLKDLPQRKFEKAVIPVEGNILEMPIADYSRGKIDKTKNFVAYKWDNVRTEVGSMYGRLTGYDEKVLKAGICYFTEKVDGIYIANFSLYELAKKLEIPIAGRDMKRLRLSLERIGALTITHTSFFLLKGKEHRAVRGYHAFKSFYMPNKDDKKREIYFVWSDLIATNLLAKYFKYLDFKVYLALPTPISRRLYDYLEKKLGKKDTHFEAVEKLIQKIPISEKNDRQAKKILIQNLERLRATWKEEKGVILQYKIKNDIIFFTRSHKKTKEEYQEEERNGKQQAEKGGTEQHRRNAAFAQLVNLRVSDVMILNLLNQHDLEIIENQLKWLPYRKTTKSKAGLIVQAIKNNWTMPARYEEEREGKLRKRKAEEGDHRYRGMPASQRAQLEMDLKQIGQTPS